MNGRILCDEAKRYVGNFMSVHRVRPEEDPDSDVPNSDDMLSDEELELDHDSLPEALETKVGGRKKGDADEGAAEGGEGVSHYQNSKAAIDLASEVWQGSSSLPLEPPSFVAPEDVGEAIAAARKSQKQAKPMSKLLGAADREASLRSLTSASCEDVDKWLADLKVRVNAEGRRVCNVKQYEAVALVAERVKQELKAAADPKEDFGEPLRWLFHGGPGTGKSHVIKIIKEFCMDVLHWDMGVHFQVVAFQAVMADLLGGDTIHHACGIPVMERASAGADHQRHMEIAKKLLQWRWLIIDEISMVSARLLAQMDVKLRDVIRDIGTAKVGSDKRDRPFGGLNVIMCGDFWQLDPPDGGYLGRIPVEFIQNARKHNPAPTVAHGQGLLWGGADHGVQGVTELEDESCADAVALFSLSHYVANPVLSSNQGNSV